MCIFFGKYKKKPSGLVKKLDKLKVKLLSSRIDDIDCMISTIFTDYYVVVTDRYSTYAEYIGQNKTNQNHHTAIKFSSISKSLDVVIIDEIVDYYDVDKIKSFIYIIVWWYILKNYKNEIQYISIRYDEVCRTATVKYYIYDDIEMLVKLVKLN